MIFAQAAPKFDVSTLPGPIVAVGLVVRDAEHGPEDEALYAATLAAEEWAREAIVGLVEARREDGLAVHRAWAEMADDDRAAVGSYLDAIGWEMKDTSPFHRLLALVTDSMEGWLVEFPPKAGPMTHEALLGGLLTLARAYEADGTEMGRYLADMLRDHAAEAEGYGSKTWREFDGRRESYHEDMRRQCDDCCLRVYEERN